MGHAVSYNLMPIGTTKTQMIAWESQFIQENADRLENPYPSPAYELKLFDDRLFEDYDEAVKFLDNYADKHGGGYADAAVHLRDARITGNLEPTATIKRLEESLSKLRATRIKTHDEALPSKRKGLRITCPKCESHLANRYLGDRDRCPVCGENLLSKTVNDRLASLDKRIKDRQNEINAAWQRQANRAPTMWLVRASCHC